MMYCIFKYYCASAAYEPRNGLAIPKNHSGRNQRPRLPTRTQVVPARGVL